MATLNDICDALMATITEHTGLRCTELHDSPPAPCAMVYPEQFGDDSGAYYSAFKRGVFRTVITVHVLVPSANSPRAAQRALNDYVSPDGPESIPQAIHEHPTLGTDANEAVAGTPTMTATAGAPTEYGYTTGLDGTRYLGVKVPVQVMCRGDE